MNLGKPDGSRHLHHGHHHGLVLADEEVGHLGQPGREPGLPLGLHVEGADQNQLGRVGDVAVADDLLERVSGGVAQPTRTVISSPLTFVYLGSFLNPLY